MKYELAHHYNIILFAVQAVVVHCYAIIYNLALEFRKSACVQ